MAGDWIKMRGNLWDDPRVARLCDATDQGEAAVIGALYWLWAAADQHTTDGFMPGLSFRQIDRKTGVPGIAEALADIDWIQQEEGGIRIIRFDEHNGASAKRRAQEAKRKADSRKVSASNADKGRTKSGSGAELEKEKEKEKEYPPHTGAAGFVNGDEGHYSPGQSFRMHDGFTPSDISAQLLSAGIPIEFFDRGMLVEFITFWKTRPNQETQAGWESKLVGRLIDRYRKQGHGSQASGSSGKQSGGLSLSERVALANQ